MPVRSSGERVENPAGSAMCVLFRQLVGYGELQEQITSCFNVVHFLI